MFWADFQEARDVGAMEYCWKFGYKSLLNKVYPLGFTMKEIQTFLLALFSWSKSGPQNNVIALYVSHHVSPSNL